MAYYVYEYSPASISDCDCTAYQCMEDAMRYYFRCVVARKMNRTNEDNDLVIDLKKIIGTRILRSSQNEKGEIIVLVNDAR